MAVEELHTGMVLIKNGNSISEAVSVESSRQESYDDLYGDRNIDVRELANLLADKINIPDKNMFKPEAIDIDIKREISINKVDKNAVKSEVITGKVNNKLEKLRTLKRNGTTNN